MYGGVIHGVLVFRFAVSWFSNALVSLEFHNTIHRDCVLYFDLIASSFHLVEFIMQVAKITQRVRGL